MKARRLKLTLPPDEIEKFQCEHTVKETAYQRLRNWRKKAYGEKEEWWKCRKAATFDVDGKRLCAQHAGQLALKNLLGEEDD